MAPPNFDQRGNVMYYAALGDISWKDWVKSSSKEAAFAG